MNTLESFAVTPANELALAVAKAIVRDAGTRYNPFFLYGERGSGKTHLLLALKNAMGDKHRNSRVLYKSGEEFASELEGAAACDGHDDFIRQYRSCDVLMVDGIEAISNRENLQKILMELVDDFCADDRQIILASELNPVDLPFIYEHCRSNYEGALICDIVPTTQI